MTGLNGLPWGSYGCRLDGTRAFESNLRITSSGMYSGGYGGGSQEAPLSYDPVKGKVTFLSGDYFTATGVAPAHHFVGQYPSTFSGDTPGTILLSEIAGYPNDSDGGPAAEGSASGLWHCTPTSVSTAPSTAPSVVAAAPVPASSGTAMSVPFGYYLAGYVPTQSALRMRSDGTYTLGPNAASGAPNSDPNQSGSYRVIDAASIQFISGPYAGNPGALTTNYKGTGRKYIDVTYRGTTTSYEYIRP
ncbi:MAG: hypothetical protein ACR2MY_01320 [Candidatus Dormibacteria bacterium]